MNPLLQMLASAILGTTQPKQLASPLPPSGGLMSQNIPEPLTISQLIAKIFPEDPKTAKAIFTHESQLGKYFKNLGGSNAYGVAQIMLPSHRNKIPGANDPEKIEYLRNPENNLKIARQIYDAQGWNPWQSYTSGAYKKYLEK